MNELINIEAKNTLTSLEVAEITGKDHKNILADIRDEDLSLLKKLNNFKSR